MTDREPPHFEVGVLSCQGCGDAVRCDSCDEPIKADEPFIVLRGPVAGKDPPTQSTVHPWCYDLDAVAEMVHDKDSTLWDMMRDEGWTITFGSADKKVPP